MRRGDPEFDEAVHAAIAILRSHVQAARDERETLMTYGELSELLRAEGHHVPPRGEPMSSILAEVSNIEAAKGRGLLSAVAVLQAGQRPAQRFYDFARASPHRRAGGDEELWLTELQRIFNEGRDDRTVTLSNLGAWMIKCNPDVWDLGAFIADGGDVITDWSVIVTYRTGLMAADQPILFWVTGRDTAPLKPGIWGIGTVSASVVTRQPPTSGGYWKDDAHRLRSRSFVPVDIPLLPTPISRSLLREDARLSDLEVFRQPQMGNPLFVSREELEVLAEYIPANNRDVAIATYGAGFASPEVRRLVEAAAVNEVTRWYNEQGWSVVDVSAQKLGWDLNCTSTHSEVHEVEVKGVTGLAPTILLTRGEARAAATRPCWRLAVVTGARSTPHLKIVNGQAALARATPFVLQVGLEDL